MVARFYFPHKKMIYHVRLHHTIMLMHPSQQANFIAYASKILAKDINYESAKIPTRFKPAARLIGANLSEQELVHRYKNSDEKIEGPIYPDPEFQGVLIHPEAALITAREEKTIFFPYWGTYQLGYDCFPKTINAILRCGFFT
jgi:hypothetical protein